MNCLQATRLLSEAMDRPLTWQEQARLKVHLGMCRGCRQLGEKSILVIITNR